MLCTCNRCGAVREGNEMFFTADNTLLCYHPAQGDDCYQIVQDEHE